MDDLDSLDAKIKLTCELMDQLKPENARQVASTMRNHIEYVIKEQKHELDDMLKVWNQMLDDAL